MVSDLSPAELSGTCTPARPAKRDWRPVLGPYLEGKLCLALAVGLSQREAENWVDQGEEIIGQLLAVDELLAAMRLLLDKANTLERDERRE